MLYNDRYDEEAPTPYEYVTEEIRQIQDDLSRTHNQEDIEEMEYRLNQLQRALEYL